MLKIGAVALVATAAAALTAAPAQAASFLASASSGCGIDGCFSGDTHTFTQSFAANAFQGTVDVGSLLLDRAILGGMQDQLFKVSFHLADGTALGSWGSFMIAVLNGQVVTLSGNTIEWNTNLGDLVLQLDLLVPDKNGVGGGGGGGLFSAPSGRSIGGFGGAGMVAQGFSGGGGDVNVPATLGDPDLSSAMIHPAVAVPEPAAWSLMILGFGAAGAILRRRQFRFA